MDKRLKRSVRLSVILYWIYFSSQAEGACSWPAVFGSTQWHDSSRGDINFGGTSMTGWSFSPTTNVIVSEWECLSVDTFDTDGRMLLLTTNSFSIFNTDLYAYMCITLIKVTESSYRYYMNCPIKTNVNNERLFVYNVNTLTDVNTICCNSSVTSGSEYQMLIRAGSESSAKVNCPWEILGSYGYTHTTVTGTVTCDSSPSQMDMCANSTQMTFNHGTCATKVTYSNSNTVWCVDNVPVGDANFVMVYNGNDDTADIDGSTIYSFTCIAVSSTGDKASVSPENCQDGQSPDQFPVNPSGVTIGAKLALSVTASCPTCPVLSNPNRATVSISSNGAVTTAVYTCEGNYSLTGESTRTCQANKTWSGSEPFCNCASPASIGNGTLTLNSNGTVATYTCDVGFTLDGLATRTCQIATATWEDVDPVCVNCESLVDGSGRSYTLSTDGTVTTAFYTCAQKYSLSGATSLICASTGTWDQDQPTCVSCGFLTNPHSGSVTITTNGSTSTATYACSTGYTRVGSETRTCQLSGVWDNSQPTCQCDSPSSPDNGALIADGATATYTCKTNYSLSGDASRSCQEDSSGWSGSDPSCSLCDTLSTVTGGSVALSTTGTVTSATYTCTIGYSLNGSTPITCSSTGSWDTASPTCVMCPTLANPSSGTATLSTTGTQTSASYACASGYDLNDSNGNTIRVCNSDGSWSLTSPTCTCQSPSGITHGSVKEDGVTANYTCDQGYSLNGVSTRTCDSNGNGWSGSDPSCATCDTLTAQTGGTVTIATDGQTTQASFTCDSGYTLNGQTPITCRSSDGTWDFTQPNCAKCPDLTAPSGGSFTMTTTGTVTSASFACGSAYYISGAYLLTCQTDGSWDHSEPTCKCNFPSTPTNGGVSVSDGSTGTFATYSCDTGYSLSGLVTRACQTDNTGWEGSDPTCVICQIVTVPASGTLSLSTSGTQTIVTYSCDQGTSLNGDTTLVCQSDGTFDKTIPTCVDCPTLSNPSSGSVSLTTDGTVTTGTFSCLSGYTLTSTSSVLTCLTSGAWDITAPSCVCESPPLVANGELVLSSDLSTVTYTCDTGYVLVGSQSRTCSEIGTGWDGIAPSCEECLTLSTPTGGNIDLSTNGLTTMANFTCLAGYTLDGDHFLTCQLDTAWTPSLPVCVECTTLENPFSGKVALTTDGLVTIATYSCLADYYMIGTEIRTCQTDGAWDLLAPECDCNAPATPSGGSVVVSGTTATYTCDMRYTLSGSETRTCQRDGTGWSGADPTCTSCASLIGPTSGVYALTTDGVQTSASLSCGNGYSLNGALEVKCLSDGTWETLPTCIHCDSLSSPDSGSFSLSTTGINTLATYACTTGYNLNGDTSRMCLSTGIWTLAAPTCSCQSPTIPSNGHVTDDGATATYTCSVGYSLDGVSSRTCGSDGTGWSGSDPSCTPCSTLTTPTGGTVTLTTDNLQTMASYTCDVGYTLNGLSSITCRSDGTWDFSQPECSICPTLTAPSSGNVSLSTDQLTTTASFLCSSGYYISGSLTITCRTDGQWSDNVPTCKCNFPAHPGNGAVSVSDTSSGPVASYSCDLGYSIEGSASRLCLSDGTGWDATDPSCNVCASITTPTEMGFAQSTNGTTTKGSYTCAVNYTLDGEPVHECLADGTWNNQQPSCVQCEITYNPLSGSVSLSTDGLTTMATFSCVSGYSLNSTSITTCQTDATWNLPSPTCLCDPPPAVNNGVIVLLNEGRLANYTCNEGYELVGTYMRTCQDDGTGWTGTSPRCDAIQNTPASSAASTDNSVLPLHLGIVVALVAVIVTLLIAVIICTYLRYRKDNSKISATFDDGESEMPIAEESRHNTERGISNGKAHLIGKEIEKKPSFNVKKLKQDTSASDVRINASTPPVPVKENGASHSLPLTSVRLPKLPPKPPQAHQINSNKPKRKRTSPRKHVTPRTSTPIEIQMSRVETPEILSTAEFNYINPVYCHEVETPTSSRPTTCNDSNRRSFRVNQASSSESNA